MDCATLQCHCATLLYEGLLSLSHSLQRCALLCGAFA
jgi:hypothetical protein